MMNKTCKNCTYYSGALMVCFNEANEGIRVFNPDNQTCRYFKPIEKCTSDGEDCNHTKSNIIEK